MNNEYREKINEFLAAIKKKLPGWLKDKKEESQEVLDEIEEYIYDNPYIHNGSKELFLVFQNVKLAI